GLYAKWLFEAITALHWHPLLRVKNQGKFRPQGWYHWVDMPDLVAHVGQRWQGRGTAFKTASAQLDCTLLACWGEGYADPWLVLTDLPPEAGDVCWYGFWGWGGPALRGGCCPWAARRMRRCRRRRWTRCRTRSIAVGRVGV